MTKIAINANLFPEKKDTYVDYKKEQMDKKLNLCCYPFYILEKLAKEYNLYWNDETKSFQNKNNTGRVYIEHDDFKGNGFGRWIYETSSYRGTSNFYDACVNIRTNNNE